MYPYVLQNRLNKDVINHIQSFLPKRKSFNKYLQKHLQHSKIWFLINEDEEILGYENKIQYNDSFLMVEYDRNEQYVYFCGQDCRRITIEIKIEWVPPSYFEKEQKVILYDEELFVHPNPKLQPIFYQSYLERLKVFSKNGRRLYSDKELEYEFYCENEFELNECKVNQYKEFYRSYFNKENEISYSEIDKWFILKTSTENNDCVILGDSYYGWYIITPIDKIETQLGRRDPTYKIKTKIGGGDL